MKTIAKCWVVGVMSLVAMGCGAGAAEPPYSPPPRVTVQVENEAESIAKGFEAAFEELPNQPKYVVLRTEAGGLSRPGTVRSVRAFGGVLLITLDSGLAYAVSALDVERITTEKV